MKHERLIQVDLELAIDVQQVQTVRVEMRIAIQRASADFVGHVAEKVIDARIHLRQHRSQRIADRLIYRGKGGVDGLIEGLLHIVEPFLHGGLHLSDEVGSVERIADFLPDVFLPVIRQGRELGEVHIVHRIEDGLHFWVQGIGESIQRGRGRGRGENVAQLIDQLTRAIHLRLHFHDDVVNVINRRTDRVQRWLQLGQHILQRLLQTRVHGDRGEQINQRLGQQCQRLPLAGGAILRQQTRGGGGQRRAIQIGDGNGRRV